MVWVCILLAAICEETFRISWLRWRAHFPPGYDLNVSAVQVKAAVAELGTIRDRAVCAARAVIIIAAVLP